MKLIYSTLLVVLFISIATLHATEAQLFEGMGPHERAITTDSREAQAYFNQGLTWMYSFNHDEAIRSFKKAAELDPSCAMAWWGVSLAAGPQYNHPKLTEERSGTAWKAMQEAIRRMDNATDLERSLIEALRHRNALTEPDEEGRKQLNQAYADAMSKIWKAHPNDSDVGSLYAESLMIRRPWKLYSVKDQAPHEDTPYILSVLERVLAIDPDHPGALHLYIHAIEPSKQAYKGLFAADRLSNLVPGSGHMLHMPSHIYVKAGQWEKAYLQNERAMKADTTYRLLSPEQKAQHIYMTHNAHVAVYAALMGGREEEAMAAARNMWSNVDEKILSESPRVERWMSSVYDVHKRFGRWDELLAEPAPPEYMLVTNATWRAARAVAYAAKKDFENAEKEYDLFRRARERIPRDYLWSSDTVDTVLEVSNLFIAGEIALQKEQWSRAAELLVRAIRIEDGLAFREPPQWVQPTRHTLGVVYLKAGRFKEAESVYRNDLEKWPNNGWSLYGLSQALAEQGRTSEASAAMNQHLVSWKDADAPIATSCKCVPKI